MSAEDSDSALAVEATAAGQPRLLRREIAMVGDDLETDVRAAQRAGLRGIFVLSGKHTRDDLTAAARRGVPAPDLVAESLADVVAALD